MYLLIETYELILKNKNYINSLTISCICVGDNFEARSGAESRAAASSASGGKALLSAGCSMAPTPPRANHVVPQPMNGLADSRDCFLY